MRCLSTSLAAGGAGRRSHCVVLAVGGRCNLWEFHGLQAAKRVDYSKSSSSTDIWSGWPRLTELQWRLQSGTETKVPLVREDRVDEQKTLAELDNIVSLEREIKRDHLSLLIRIRTT